MELKTETWGREISEIVNYDSKELFNTELKIRSTGCLYRLHNRIFFMNEGTNLNDYENLLKINKHENRYEIILNKYEFDEKGNISSANSAWFLLKKSKMKEKYNKYKLKKGDIIKIGRILTKIKDIKFEKKNNKSKKENSSFDFELISTQSKNENNPNKILLLKDVDNLNNISNEKEQKSHKNKVYSLANQRNATDSNLQERIQILNLNTNNKSTDKKIKLVENEENIIKKNKSNNLIKKIGTNSTKKIKTCRICYLEEESPEDNPLVQPCKCSGSLKYIHLKCLKHWIMTRSCQKIEEGDFCSVFLFKEVECEICKAKLPDLVNHNGKYHYLLDFSDDFKRYLILETLTLDEDGNKFIYVISLLNKEIKIGRGILSDILLSDVSVSRIHCMLDVEGDNVFIKDNDSKFGTLILIQTPIIKMTENLPLNIQVGRTFLNFEIKLIQKNFFCCNVSENANVFYYYMQNDKQVKLNSMLTVKNDEINNSNEEDEEEDMKKESEIKDNNVNIINNIDNKNENENEIIVVDSNEDDSIKIVIENE